MLSQVFNLSEKRTFVETLLIVAGVLTGFNPLPIKTLIFVNFAVLSIVYIIWISIIKNIKEKNFSRIQYVINWVISGFLGVFFSALVFLIGLQANLENIKNVADIYSIMGGWTIFYMLLGIILTIVLGLRQTNKKLIRRGRKL